MDFHGIIWSCPSLFWQGSYAKSNRQTHAGTDPEIYQGDGLLRFQVGSFMYIHSIISIIIAVELKVEVDRVLVSAYCNLYHTKHAFTMEVWVHTPRKILKICSPEIESRSSFDENYETVKLMVGG